MITKLLSTAVKFYLRSQVSQAESLQVKIVGKNRQILKGYIPEVFLYCQHGVYQGLHLQEVEVQGADIAFNLSEVLKKQPFRLLEPIVVNIKLSLAGNDLKASIDSALLQSGLKDLWQIIISAQDTTPLDSQIAEASIKWHNIAIANNRLHLSGTYQDSAGKSQQLDLFTGIALANHHTLCLSPLKINDESGIVDDSLKKLEIDLGQDVVIEKLNIESEQILCLGKITVN